MSGPVAMMARRFSGSASMRFRLRFMSGCSCIFLVTACANRTLSTARALPAGSLFFSAQSIMSESQAFISRWSIPTALASGLELRNEFEQTSSAQRSVLCAGVRLSAELLSRIS